MIYHNNLPYKDQSKFFLHAERRQGPVHEVLHDTTFDLHCEYMSDDEVAILFNLAQQLNGKWVEIGTHTGFSLSHIAAAGVELALGIDPQFENPSFRERTSSNLDRCGLSNYHLWGGTGDSFFKLNLTPWSGCVIDGNHNPGAPLNDARLCFPWLLPDAVVVLHDFIGYPVQEAVDWLVSQGMHYRVYNTQQLLGVCWQGSVVPPKHQADSSVDWKIRRRTSGYHFRGEE